MKSTGKSDKEEENTIITNNLTDRFNSKKNESTKRMQKF